MFSRPNVFESSLYGGHAEPLPITDANVHLASEGLTLQPHETAVFIGMLVITEASLDTGTVGLSSGWQSISVFPGGVYIPFGPSGVSTLELASGEVLGAREVR